MSRKLALLLLPVATALVAPLRCGGRRASIRHVLAEPEQTTAEDVVSDADSVPKALADLWKVVAAPPDGGAVLRFPACAEMGSPTVRAALFEHLECCKDNCDSFGSAVVVAPEGRSDVRVRRVGRASSDPYAFDDDDDWGDDDDFLSPEMRAMLAGAGGDDDGDFDAKPPPSAAAHAPLDDAGVIRCCKDWTNAIVSDAGICPFSLSADRAGLPLGDVRYDVTRAADAESVYSWYWKEVAWLEDHPRAATSLLICADEFWLKNLEAFETFGASLAQALQTGTEAQAAGLGLESQLQLVFFHPDYVFRDGAERTGADAAANFARRSPFPMINILRTPQVRAAQKGLPTGLVYQQNEETLRFVGAGLLDDMLRTRDWSAMEGNRVDRTKIEVLKLARGMMEASGVAATDDLSKTGAAAERATGDLARAAADGGCPFAADVADAAGAAAPAIADAAVAAAGAPAHVPADLSDWRSAEDAASGKTYYYNEVTQATSWVWPPA